MRLPDEQALGERPEPQPSAAVATSDGTAIGRAQMQEGQAVTDLGEVFMRGEQIARSKSEAVERARALGAFQESAAQELQRLSTEDDLSRPETMSKYGEFLNKQKMSAVEGHKGSRESQMQLLMRVEQQRSRIATQAGVLAQAASQKMVEQAVGQRGNMLAGRAYENPGSLIELYREFDEHINDIAPALKPEQEQQFRSVWRGHMASLALESLVTRGAYADAETLLQMPGISEVLGPDAQKTVRKNILDAKYKVRNAQMAAIAEASGKREGLRVLLGREPTDLELAQAAGVMPKAGEMFGGGANGRALEFMTNLAPVIGAGAASPAQQRQWEAAVTQYQQPIMAPNPDTGVMETRRPELPPFVREAMRRGGGAPANADIFAGRPPEEVDAIRRVMDAEARGERLTVSVPGSNGSGGGAPATDRRQPAQADRRAPAAEPRAQTAWGLSDLTTGPIPAAGEALSRTPGVGAVIRAPQFTQARSFLPRLQDDLVHVLQNNPRYAEGERKAIAETIKIEASIFDTPQAYRDRLIGIDNALVVREHNAEVTANSDKVGRDERVHAMNVLNALRLFRKNLGVPPRVKDDADRNELKSGQEYISPDGQIRRKQ